MRRRKTNATPELVDNLVYLKAKGVEASAHEDVAGFVVLKGAQAVKTEVQSLWSHYSALRADLVEQGVLIDEGSHYVFSQDQVFSGPSSAAGVILGVDGYARSDWVTKEGRTLKDLQEAAAEDGMQ